ncbi:MAG: hypothetical protein HS122_08690 [Opitutaceae bacterium]|nr:hypothetical protein [Opitutaceae bacterium]
MNTLQVSLKRVKANLVVLHQILQLMDDGDAIIGSTAKSRAQRAELAGRISALEGLMRTTKQDAVFAMAAMHRQTPESP